VRAPGGDAVQRRLRECLLAGDVVDILNNHLSRVEAQSEAICLMQENEQDFEKIGYLADMIVNEAYKGKTELGR
jgi:hypothetical protein